MTDLKQEAVVMMCGTIGLADASTSTLIPFAEQWRENPRRRQKKKY